MSGGRRAEEAEGTLGREVCEEQRGSWGYKERGLGRDLSIRTAAVLGPGRRVTAG